MLENVKIQIKHVPSGRIIEFDPYLNDFSDNFKSDWEQTYVMGRMDPIATFKRTTRTIKLAFSVPSSNKAEAIVNYNKSSELAMFLYPFYKVTKSNNFTAGDQVVGEVDVKVTDPKLKAFYDKIKSVNSLEQQLNLRPNISTMSSGPLVGIKFTNLISTENNDYLYGFLGDFNFSPDKEMGYYISDQDLLVPKSFDIVFNFTVIHANELGWDSSTNKPRGPFKV